MRLSRLQIAIAASLTATIADPLPAENVYFIKSIRDLEITDGDRPNDLEKPQYNQQFWNRWHAMRPYATLDGPGEVYVSASFRAGPEPPGGDPNPRNRLGARGNRGDRGTWIAIRTDVVQDVTGRLYVVKQDGSGMLPLKFRISADQAAANHERAFLRTKQSYYHDLLLLNPPGAGWFRHQFLAVGRQLGSTPEIDNVRRSFGTPRANDMENTFALFSGGRAVSENLQLDRALPRTKPDAETVRLDSIEGITIREFDWQPLIKDADPQTDPLAALIPDDQHALFFPSFAAMTDLIDHAEQQGTPLLRSAEPRAENALTRERYQRQLCLPLGEVERFVGPQLISSVAVTGGDPYFRTGTDVAVLFEATNATALRGLIQARVDLARNADPEARRLEGAVRGVNYVGARTPDRRICSYVAQLGDTVVVTNSLAQLSRLVEVQQGQRSALAALPEYTFFRSRYPFGDEDETGLLIISDKTIRRWCSPMWRIATSRRTRAAAVVSELQAKHLDQLVSGEAATREIEPGHWLPETGRFTVTPGGVTTSTYGGLDFQTPIMELDVEYATAEEARFYARWRDGYQSNWSNFFDPIAVRFHASEDRLATDLTVMPLIDNSDYSRLVELSQGAKLMAADGDPHKESLVHWALALNRESPLLKQYAGFAGAFAPQIKVDPLSWVGNVVAAYADDDGFWKEFAAAEDERKAREFMEQNVHRLPVALHVKVRNGLKLTAFLAGVRAFIEQSAPGMTVWETKEHEGRSYVKISPSAQARSNEEFLEDLAVYYSASGEALNLTLNEDLLKRAMDREAARRMAKNEGEPIPRSGPDWIGDNMCFAIDRRFVDVFQPLFRENYQHMMQARSWGNLPILNEWKRRYPNQDPVELHEKFWHRRLVCPGEGEYRWNAEWQTMESTVYGHPGEPKSGPVLAAGLREIQWGSFGVTFEEHGLRASVELRKKPRD